MVRVLAVWLHVCLFSFAATAPHELKIQDGAFLKYYGTSNLQSASDATRAVVVVHGMLRNAQEYGDHVVKAATLSNVLEDTIIIAPMFQNLEDNPTATELAWTEKGWKKGDDAIHPKEMSVSTFQAMDVLLRQFSHRDRFPKLRSLTVTGHSAGGQFVARYSVGNAIVDGLDLISRFVIANPSTYLYLNEFRPESGSQDFSVPEGCSSYDDYAYGLKNRNAYMKKTESREFVDRLEHRDVQVLLGEKDTESEDLDVSCGAEMQGKHRRERGENFVRYVMHFFPASKLALTEVPGVGHEGAKMFQSPEGRSLLFY